MLICVVPYPPIVYDHAHHGILPSINMNDDGHFIPTIIIYSGCEKREAHINWSVVTCKMAAPVTGTTLRTTGPVLADSRQ